MSSKLPPRPPKVHTTAAPRFAIVVSEYNPEFAQPLVNHTCNEIYRIDENSIIELFGAPGSFEIPLAVQLVAAAKRHDALIALGVVMQGRTKHAEFIMGSVSDALLRISLEHAVPVIHEVLLVNSAEEAKERCVDKSLNRGIEAARAAFSMLRLKEQLKPKRRQERGAQL